MTNDVAGTLRVPLPRDGTRSVPTTTRLLVSVRDAAEAEIALAGGADLIDVKEPLRGALGAADPQVWDEVQRVVRGRVPTSVALGELCDNLSCACAGATYVKLGLAGCVEISDWAARWQNAIAQLPASVQPVAVIYADHQTAKSPPPGEILRLAKPAGCAAVLVDTFDKSAGGLLNHMSLADIATLVRTCHREGLACVLAGKLTADSIETLLPLAPDYVGVRGAACDGARTVRLDLGRVKSLAKLVHSAAKELASTGA